MSKVGISFLSLVNYINIVYNYTTDKLLRADIDKYHRIGMQKNKSAKIKSKIKNDF